jgi:hypothetical protein
MLPEKTLYFGVCMHVGWYVVDCVVPGCIEFYVALSCLARRLARQRGPTHTANQIIGIVARLIPASSMYVHPVPRAFNSRSMTETVAAPKLHLTRLFYW